MISAPTDALPTSPDEKQASRNTPLAAVYVFTGLVILSSAPRVLAPRLHEILYTSEEALCSVAASGGRAICLKTGEGFNDPSWNPNGTRIVARAAPHFERGGLVLLDSTGRLIRRLDQSTGAIRPVWSPDGRSILAIDYRIGSAVARWTNDGRTRERLPVIGGADSGQKVHPDAPRAHFQLISLSPSGRRAALLTMPFREMLLARVSDTALFVFATAPHGFDYVSQAAWLDDEHLLFIGKQGTKRGQLWELHVADGTVRKRGVDGLWLRDQLALSLARNSVAVTAVGDSSDGHWSVWTYSLSTMITHRLTRGLEDVVGSWH
jgi:hypothetical protein